MRQPWPFVALSILVLSLSLEGCGNSRVEELENQVAKLESQLEGVRSKLSDAESEVGTLKGAVDDLTSAVDGFGYMDWRIAVSNVRSAQETSLASLHRVSQRTKNGLLMYRYSKSAGEDKQIG